MPCFYKNTVFFVKGYAMDIRSTKSRRKISDAFLLLRSSKEIEKITVTEICSAAGINKSTFYFHYRDIYDLSDKIETELVEEIVSSLSEPQNILDDPNAFTKSLFYAYMKKEAVLDVVFSGSRSGFLSQKTEQILKNLFFSYHPDLENDVETNVNLSMKIYGGFYAFQTNRQYDPEKVIAIIGSMSSSGINKNKY